MRLHPTVSPAAAHPSEIFRTVQGQHQVILLPEGSRVTLDAGSVLELRPTALVDSRAGRGVFLGGTGSTAPIRSRTPLSQPGPYPTRSDSGPILECPELC